MKIVSTYNIKGGVGKTTTAVNLAYLAAQDGYRTLLWDLDPQGAASFSFRIRPKIKGGLKGLKNDSSPLTHAIKATDFEGLDLIPADFSLRKFDQQFSDTKKNRKRLHRLLTPISQEYDLLFIDSAPSISLLSENIFYAADALLIPVIPTTFSVRTYSQLLDYFRENPQKELLLMPFFSMYDKERALHREIIETLPDEFKEILKSIIPYTKKVELMGVERTPVGQFAPESKPWRAFKRLWLEVREKLINEATY